MSKSVITVKKLLALVAEEAQNLTLPGVIDAEGRYPLLHELWILVVASLPYGERSFGLRDVDRTNWSNAQHYMKICATLFATTEAGRSNGDT